MTSPAPKFRTTMHHPSTGGETVAATARSHRILTDRGWKDGPAPVDPPQPTKKPAAPKTAAPKPDPTS